MLDRHIPGMGEYSQPSEPNEERAEEEALIAVATWAAKVCVDDLREIAEEEHAIFFRSIGEDPDAIEFGDWEGAWYEIYAKALDAYAVGVRLEKLRKQEVIRDDVIDKSH